ncbi:hypothetical protein QTH87_15575 [Variovorax sp. J22P168]|uniref:hypothetical protein n=1 Tax=Variovorax jilinensis TaxID=3053513 RepID=UPI0025788885|nr:hypothetical protein [Variovorax sp. J22P168]MDM0013857.1 hypothetical protein [Variovorax sp. J22P168]
MKTFAAPDRASPGHHGLVIVEGIMGSGKSTTMRLVAKALAEAGRPALAIHERTDPHPVRATDELRHWFEPWLETTVQGLAGRAVSRWASFAEEVRGGAAVPVLDGQLFHGDLTHLFLMEASFDQLAAYCERVAGCIAPLHPLVVYLRQEDVERAVRTICAERGDAWVKYQVDWKLKGPLAVRRRLSGLDGLIALYEEYRTLTDALFDRLSLDKIVIENSERDWKRYDRQILGRLGLDGAPTTCS